MKLRDWIMFNAAGVVALTLVAAATTHNPNWMWNIPLGLLAGAAWGFLSWPVLKWVMGIMRGM